MTLSEQETIELAYRLIQKGVTDPATLRDRLSVTPTELELICRGLERANKITIEKRQEILYE